MNFDLDEDESLLKALAENFAADRYDLDRRRGYLAQPQGFSTENWRILGEIGLIATAFSEAAGGFGTGPVQSAILFEALGRAMLVEPLIDSAWLAGGLFEAVAPAALGARWLPDLVHGQRRLALAHREEAARDRFDRVDTVASGGRVTGDKALVAAAVGADAFLVTARDGDGIAIYLADAGAPGLILTPYRLIDGTLAARVAVVDTPAERLAGDLSHLLAAQARADLAHAAEALGLMELLMEQTLDHLRTRRQFGQPIGSFQALQHRMVAHYVAVEQARGLVHRAAMAPPGDGRAIAGARAFIAEASVRLGHDAIQLHGGMGVSDELVIGHAHKRLFRLSRHPGSAAAALDRFAGLAA